MFCLCRKISAVLLSAGFLFVLAVPAFARPLVSPQFESDLFKVKGGTYPKHIVVKYYTPVDKGFSVEVGEPTSSIYEVFYNERYQAYRFCEYNLDGSLNELYERTFNDNGLLKTEQKKGKDRLLVLTSEYVYQNPSQERSLQTQKIYDPEKKLLYVETYHHDKAGNITSTQRNNEAGASVFTVECTYDAKGRKEREIRLNASGGKITEEEFEYDADGNKSVSIRYNAQGKVTQHVEYDYYDNGLVKSRTITSPNGPQTFIRLEYEYDSRGNWIKQIMYKGPDVPTTLIVRKLEYF